MVKNLLDFTREEIQVTGICTKMLDDIINETRFRTILDRVGICKNQRFLKM